MSPRLVLVGPPGAGKSTVGKALARRWSETFVDADTVIEEREHSTIPDLFVERGEPYFREVEAEVVAELLSESSGVLSLGGGAVLDERTRALLADHTVVFLDADLSTAAARVGLNRDRPLLLGNVRGTLAILLQERRPLYVSVATHVVDTVDRDIGQVVEQVAALMEGSMDERR